MRNKRFLYFFAINLLLFSNLRGSFNKFELKTWLYDLQMMENLLKRGNTYQIDSIFLRVLKSPFVMPWARQVNRPEEIDSLVLGDLKVLEKNLRFKKLNYIEGLLLLILNKNFETYRRLREKETPFSKLLLAILEKRKNNYQVAEKILHSLRNEEQIKEDVLYLLGYTLKFEGKFEPAKEILDTLIFLFPRSVYKASSLALLGDISKETGMYDDALRYYKSSLEYNPIFRIELLAEISEIYKNLGKFKEALSYYKKIIKATSIESKLNKVLLDAGRVARKIGEDSLAEEFLKRIEGGDEAENAWYMLAQIYFDRGDYDEAESKLLGLLGWAHQRKVIYNSVCLLSKIYVVTGKLDIALSYIKGLLQDPHISLDCLDEARYLYEWIRYLKGYYTSPLHMNEAFSDLYPESPRAPKLLFEVFLYYSKKHLKEKALSIFEKLITRYPDDILTFKALKELHLFLPKEDEYLVWKKYIEKKKEDSLAYRALYTMGKWAEERGDLDYALNYYEKVSESEIYRREALFRMANILKKIKKEDEAAVLFEMVYDENPSDSLGFKSLLERIVILKLSGRSEEADSLFAIERKRLKGDRLASLLFIKGKLAFNEGNWDQAKNYLHDALKSCESEEKREEIKKFIETFLEEK